MAETAGDIHALVERDDELADALAIVLDTAESGDGTVVWSDVSDDISDSQWGRLLGTGILLEAGDCFVIDDPVAVNEALGEHDSTTSVEDDDSGWSISDKLAGVSALGLVVGYRIPVVRNTVGPVIDALLTPLEAIFPLYLVVLILAAGTGFISIVIQSRMTDFELMSERQERMSAISDRLKDAKERGDEDAVERIQDEQMDAMSDQLGMFTQMIRPMVWTMLFTLPVLLWLYWLTLSPASAVTPTAMIFPMIGRVAWTAKIIGPMQAWLLWYMICSVTSRQVIQKTLNIRTSPT